MHRIALRMLMRDRGKYFALVVGLAFATLLLAQQGSIFLGLLKRATGPLQNVAQPDLWVTDAFTRYVLEYRPLADRDLERVRAVPGVAWAEPFFSSRAPVELPDGSFKTAQIIGIDRSTMIGRPPTVTQGRLEDLRAPDAIFVDESSRKRLAGVKIGDTLKLNDRRAIVVGFCQVKLGFESNAVIYTTYDNAIRFTPVGRENIPFILAKAQDGVEPKALAKRISQQTGLGAYTREEMAGRTIDFILSETGIGINFGITVLLGFVVGLAVVTAIFYQFTLENLRYFAVLKAMGTRSRTLVMMVLLQALVVGLIGFGIGIGLVGAFALTGRRPGAELTPYFPWQMLLLSLVAILICIFMGSVLSLRRVIKLEPAIVFK
ncbi:MAG TPA: ABC transporter permease [Phycisphaerales bacterium]|nr:ABC transporter permease [Phycisphaerales bacterium]